MKQGLTISDLHFLDWGPLDLSVDAGECVGLRGASGSGKTLMLRAIADLDDHEGSIRLGDVDSDSVSAPEWRRKVGMLPAESSWWHDTVGEHFEEIGEEEAGMAEKLGFDTGEVFDWEVSRLSVGERQRLALVRLLHRKPEALLLDEPTANLDEESTVLVEELIEKYRKEYSTPVFWVTHSREQLYRVATRCFLLEDKELKEEAGDK